MTASTNATIIIWGTPWIQGSLLDIQLKLAEKAQAQDGIKRVFRATADDIRKYVPAYGRTVDRVIAEKGRNHPLVRTQYFCETIEAQSGMFNPARLALIFQLDRGRVIREKAIREKPNCENVIRAEAVAQGWKLVGIDREYRGPVIKRVTVVLSDGSRFGVEPPPEKILPGMQLTYHAADGRLLERLDSGAQSSTPISEPAGGLLERLGSGAESSPPIFELENGGNQRGVKSFAFLIDVAGMDEARLNTNQAIAGDGLGNPGRDSTTLTVVEVDLSSLETLQRPTYRVAERHAWTGENHLNVFGKLKALAKKWSPQHIVIDATGVGEGLWAMLDRAFPTRVIPVKFTSQEKSEIGWRFLSIIETGRFQDPLTAGNADKLSQAVRLQYSRCICEILPGPAKTLRWGVPDGARGPEGELVHDDFIMADALAAKLDQLEWQIHFGAVMLDSVIDPLKEMEAAF
jgi:hypothetical protein